MDENNINKKADKLLKNGGSTPLATLEATMEVADKLSEVAELLANMPKTLSMEGVERIEIKGDKGEKGDSPTEEELLSLIEPLIPEPIKGDKGDTGERGADSIVAGPRGPKGEKGLPGLDGRDGVDGKDGSPDTAEQVRDKLESLIEDDRLDVTAIKGAVSSSELRVISENLRASIPKGGGGSGGVEVFSSTGKVGSGAALKFTGSGVASISSDGHTTTIDLSGGEGGGTPGGSDTQLQYNNSGSFGGITGATTNGTAVTYTTGNLIAHDVKASQSAGLDILSNSGTLVALFGAGGGANSTFYGGSKFDYATASTIGIFDSSKNLVSADTTTYPSLTELSYVKGTTSAVQTQINTKMTNPMTTGGDIIYGGASGTPTRLANGSSGQVLTSNGTTSAPSWQTPTGSGWSLTGNAGTTAGTNFLGTTDNIDVVFKRNSAEQFRLTGNTFNFPTTGWFEFSDNDSDVFFGHNGTSKGTFLSGASNSSYIQLDSAGVSIENSTLPFSLKNQIDLRFYEGANYVGFKAPALSGNVIWTLPTTDSTGTQALVSDGAGVLSWASVGGGSGITIGTTTITSGTDTRILYDNAGVVGEYTISGTGSVAMTNSPTFTTPALGTPSSGVVTNLTGTASININGTVGATTPNTGAFTTILTSAAAAGPFTTNSVVPAGQFLGTTDASGAGVVLARFSADSSGPNLYLNKSRNATVGDHTIVQQSDELGRISFGGSNGTTIDTAAYIRAIVGNTPGSSNDMPGQIRFGVTANASSTPADVLFLTDTRLVPGSNDGIALGQGGTAYSDLFLASGGIIDFNNGDITLTHSSNLLAIAGGVISAPDIVVSGSTSTQLTTLVVGSGTTFTPHLQIIEDSLSSGVGFARFANGTTNAPRFGFGKSRGSTIGSYTIVQSGDTLGEFSWAGSDGVDFSPAAAIGVYVDGTPGSNDMPGRIVFSTTADGGNAVTDRLILDSAGVLKPASNDGVALGTAVLSYSDLFLASGGVINFANGDAVVTHSSGILTVGTGDLRVTTVGTNTASVVTVGGTQTLTNKTLTSPVLTTPSAFTTGGTITLAENTSVALDPAGSADGKYSGITLAGTAGATLAFGDLCYFAAADSRWELADADAAATSGDVVLGMCVLAAAADGDPTVMLLIGNIRADTAFPTMTIGGPMYVGTTAGDIQTAQPSGTDDVIRRVGFALTADELYFNPSNDYITHT